MPIRSLLVLCGLALGLAAAAATTPVIGLDRIVAVINDDVITRTELDRRTHLIKQRIARQNNPLPPEHVLRRQILERMVQEQLQLQLAASRGIRVDDETVTGVISNIARENQMSLEQFREVLARDGYAFADFRDNIRNEMIITRLQQSQVENSITVTDQEVENQLANMTRRQGRDEEFELAHILVALPEAAAPAQIAEARRRAEIILTQLREGADFAETAIAQSDGGRALDGGNLGWLKAAQLPSIVTDIIDDMQPGDISELIRSPSGFHIVKLLNTRGAAQQQTVTQSHARHILIRTGEVLSASDARARLTGIREDVLGGADFGDLARRYSDDKGSAQRGGDLGWTDPGTFVPQFEQQLAELQPGEISAPFETQFGWHIVQLLERRAGGSAQDLQRQQAMELIRRRKVQQATSDWLRRIRDEAYVEIRLDE
ncbi:MAG: peptidylprolyl isomerase [Pseudomonadota bacterium]|nr:MAG: peptidylprolyl isomerase [Pseudomonadota bacterium]